MKARIWRVHKILTCSPRPSTIVPMNKNGVLDWDCCVDVVEDSAQMQQVQDLVDEHNALVKAYEKLLSHGD